MTCRRSIFANRGSEFVVRLPIAPVEAAWAGRRMRIGGATLEATIPCPRCVMITHPFAELPKDPAVLRAVVREAGQNLGVYATVVEVGDIRVGAEVEIL